MKKIYIISILILIVLIVGSIFFLNKNKITNNQNQIPSNQQGVGQETTLDFLAVGDKVNVFADDSLVATRIMVCGSDGCGFDRQKNSNQEQPQDNTGQQPTGATPPSGGQGPAPSGMKTGNIISGTITEIGESSLIIELSTGEFKTVSVFESTQIVKK